MKTSNARILNTFHVIACLLVFFMQAPDSKALAQTDFTPDIVIRVAHIQEAIMTIEQLASQDQSQNSMLSPEAFVQGFLKGTDWLDHDRAVVFGIVFTDEPGEQMPEIVALVPFSRPNEEFLTAYNAVARDDYYLIPLPPGGHTEIAGNLESALAVTSKKPLERFVSVDIATAQALKKAEGSIEEMIQSLGEKSLQQDPGKSADDQEQLSAEQAEAMLNGFLEMLRQVENLSIGVELNRQNIEILSELVAVTGSELAGLLAPENKRSESVLGALDLSGDFGIRFRSTPFDMAAATTFAGKYFGGFYKLMGIDLEAADSVTKPFSGETAGVMSIGPSGLAMEAISCIKPGQEISVEFLETQYIPWLLEAGEGMTSVYKDQYPHLRIEPVFVRSDNSTVAGTTVVGVEGRLPVIQDAGETVKIFQMPLRMTIVDRYMLVASDDVRMAGLIDRVESLEPVPYHGPFMQMTMQWEELIRAGLIMAPAGKEKNLDGMPDMGEIEYTVELGQQNLASRYAMKTRDIRKLKTYFASLKNLQGKKTQDTEQALGLSEPAPSAEPEKAEPHLTQGPAGTDEPETAAIQLSKDEPRYWTEKGGLYYAYGNVDAAVKHFAKAVELDPGNAAAHYNLGLAYSEKESFEKALDAVEHSLTLDPENSRYLYAKGWILMQTGDRQNGLAAIKQASESGNTDALHYMKQIAPRDAGSDNRR